MLQSINGLKILGFFLLIFGILLVIVFICFFVKNSKSLKTKELPEVEQKFDKDGFAKFYYDMLPRRQRIKNAEMEVVILDSKIRGLEEELEKTKNEMAKCCSRLNDLKAHEEDYSELDDCTQNQIDNDFTKIKTVRGVQRICVDEGTLEVYVRISYQFDGRVYDLGDYEIYIGHLGLFNVVPVRGEDVGRNGPGVYLEEKNGCISERIKSGRIAEAIEIIITCLSRVGKRERAMILKKCNMVAKAAEDNDS